MYLMCDFFTQVNLLISPTQQQHFTQPRIELIMDLKIPTSRAHPLNFSICYTCKFSDVLFLMSSPLVMASCLDDAENFIVWQCAHE